MKFSLRGLVALVSAAALLLSTAALAQDKTVLSTERDKVSYMVGSDIGRSIVAVGPDLDLASFERAIRNAFEGGQPLMTPEEARATGQALMARIGARSGQAAQPGQGEPPAVDKAKVGLLVGTDVGRSLTPIKSEIDLPVFLQAVRTSLDKGTPLMSEEEATGVRQAFSQRMQQQLEAKSAEQAQEGVRFLETNKTAKGVITTASGLQYMVLRQGAGPRPKTTETVRVHYEGKLLDGTVFDSSYQRNTPTEFPLNQVIAGWTEGVALMPVGAKYRFWVPSQLAYGAKGTPDGTIGPNATLTFDVELLAIVP
jgi:FKBP-type peptidyl-prolyl cis-trans isomerase FkpA